MGRQWKQWQTLFWGGSKITADGDCNHEIKRCLLLEIKAMTNLDSILKSRVIRDHTANTLWIINKAREFQKNTHFCCIDYAKAFDCVYHNTVKNFSRWDYQTTLPDTVEICM